VQPYVDAVLSNRPWTWESIGLGWLDGQEREVVRIRAAEVGLIPAIPVDPLTRHADFSSALVEERMLPEDLWLASDDVQFNYLNSLIGGPVEGTTWHHHELPGWMQLLAFGIHNITSHFWRPQRRWMGGCAAVSRSDYGYIGCCADKWGIPILLIPKISVQTVCFRIPGMDRHGMLLKPPRG
jgi:hypothetical protein